RPRRTGCARGRTPLGSAGAGAVAGPRCKRDAPPGKAVPPPRGDPQGPGGVSGPQHRAPLGGAPAPQPEPAMGLAAAWIDAFTDRPYGGNPAAVVRLERPIPDRAMQDLAREFGLSETAFLLPEGDGWRLRWFTPAIEVR